MSARTIRRTFAAPVVITLAASCTPPPVAHTHDNPPGPKMPAGDPKPTAEDYDRRWTIRHGDGTKCSAMVESQCPRGASCNPPPPTAYACPEGFTEGTLTILLPKGSTTCMVDYGPMECPAGASCNPPPPRELPCPK